MTTLGHARQHGGDEEALMLKARIAEWSGLVKESRRELVTVKLARRQGQPGATLTLAEEEAELKLDCAQQDLAAMEEAEQLLQSFAGRLDDAGRATLALAARLLHDVDACRPDALAGKTTRLRELRLRMPGAVN